MRVQDSNQIGLTSSMVRRKKKTVTSDESATSVQCCHINKSVNINQVRKAVKHSTVLGRCQSCNAANGSAHRKSAKNDAGILVSGDSLIPADETPPDYEPSVFFCLQCGHQGCDRYTVDKHALLHFENTAQSVAHNVVLNLASYQVWCYACDNFIPVNASKKLLECADFVYHLAGHKNSITSFVKGTGFSKENGFSQESASADPLHEVAAVVKDDADCLKLTPKVKGLNNLGNTCFFNAVVQNLGQTYLFESLLRDFCRKGFSIDLSVSLQDLGSKSCSDDEINERDHDQEQDLQKSESLWLSLGECGPLTHSVVNLFDDMKSVTKQNSVSPSALFGQVCKKAPRFKGFQQQDSHELLRYMLDAIKGEETKRTMMAVHKAFNLSEKSEEVPEELCPKIKACGQQAKHTFVDSIFGGHFISTVVCQACDTHHQIFESFLDVSLPVIDEKSFKPCTSQACKSSADGGKVAEPMDTETQPGAAKQSKHMAKKERRLAKKNASKSKKSSGINEKQPQTKNGAEEVDEKESVEANNADEQIIEMKQEEDDIDRDSKNGEVKCNGELETCVDGCQQEDTAENGKLSHSSLESESSDADVEDREESDTSQYRGMANGTDALSAGGTVEAHKETNANGHKELDHSESLPLGRISNGEGTIHFSGENLEIVDDVANGIESLQLKTDSAHEKEEGEEEEEEEEEGEEDEEEEEVLSADHSLNTAFSDSYSKQEVYSDARKAAMKTLVPREKPSGRQCSVLASLYQFTSPELLSGNNMYCCSVCNKADKEGKSVQGQKPLLTCASKLFLIYSPPAVLTLHLKRFQQIGFNLRKITHHIEFGELLDLAPFCSALCQNIRAGQRRILYSLYGVVEHSGTLRSGHYTAYVKVRHSNPGTKHFLQTLVAGQPTVRHLVRAMQTAAADMRATGEPETVDTEDIHAKQVVQPLGKWYYISDSSVSEVRNISNVLNCQAYLLFYERIE